MTTSESAIFANMFDMVFHAAHDKHRASQKGARDSLLDMDRQSLEARAARAQDPLTGAGIGVGQGPEGADSKNFLFGRLKRTVKYRWGKEEDALLARKMADMELCETDEKLLEWAAREVFEDVTRYEEMTRQALTTDVRQDTSQQSSTTSTDAQAEASSSSSPQVQTTAVGFQPPAYSHLIAGLMRTFREKFADPYLALSVFHHARTRSVASAVFGCTGPAYTELIKTRWHALRDLRGVAQALSEMRANGVVPEAPIRELVEEIRRTVGQRTIWAEERDVSGGEEGTGEVMELLNRIEELSRENVGLQKGKSKKNIRKKWRTSTAEKWKTSDESRGGNYKFNDWTASSGKSSRRREAERSSTRGGAFAFT